MMTHKNFKNGYDTFSRKQLLSQNVDGIKTCSYKKIKFFKFWRDYFLLALI